MNEFKLSTGRADDAPTADESVEQARTEARQLAQVATSLWSSLRTPAGKSHEDMQAARMKLLKQADGHVQRIGARLNRVALPDEPQELEASDGRQDPR